MEISVVITNYNYANFLARSIRSAINQTIWKDSYEVIVIDDCSTDNSDEILTMFSDRIKIIKNDSNIGLAKSCNKAILQSSGKYVIRLDSDDYIHADCLKVHKLFLENNKGEMDATSSDYYEVDVLENVISRKNGVTWPIACGIMYKTDNVIQLGLYDESLPREDMDFRHRFLKSGKQIYNIPVPLYRYTKHENSITKKL